MPNQNRVVVAPQKQRGAGVPEVAAANTAKPCALRQGLEAPVDDVRGVHHSADGAEHGTVIQPIAVSGAWGGPSTARSHGTPEKERSVP
jgi:hypothetical protein